jgi:hypothetical protein
MIMSIPQLICCGIDMKTEILHDHAAQCARAPHASPWAPPVSPRMALTVTTHHLSRGGGG